MESTGDEPLIKGLWPAFVTPFTKAGEVDVAAVAPLCDYLINVCKVDGAPRFFPSSLLRQPERWPLLLTVPANEWCISTDSLLSTVLLTERFP